MKNQSSLIAILLLSCLLSACGKKEASPPPATLAPDATLLADDRLVAAELPGPEDLPPCPGLVSIGEIRGDEHAGAAEFFSSQSGSAILDFYTTHLSAAGWVMATSIQQGQIRHLQFSRGGRFLRFQIGPVDKGQEGAVRILVAWKQPAGTEEAGDAYAPEFEEVEPSNIQEGSYEW